LLGALLLLNAAMSHAEFEGGWWWNPLESGRGYFLELQGPNLFFSAYFYDASGRATWLVSNDPMPNPDVYNGRLLAVRGGQSLVGDYPPPAAIVDAGAIGLRFTDERHGTLTWPGGTVAIERQPFHSNFDEAAPPMTGWWWNPAESGRGFSMEVQGDHMFIGAYMYDAAGNPAWYVADALMTTPTLFRGPLLQFANGQTIGGPYRAPSPAVTAGTITVQFDNADQATVTLSDNPASTAQAFTKQSKIINVRPQRLDARVPRPDFLEGSFSQTIILYADEGRHEITAPEVTWVQTDQELGNLDGSVDYEIASGTASVAFSGIHVPDPPRPPCHVTGNGVHTLQQAEGQLKIGRDGRFSGQLFFQMLVGNITCGGGGAALQVPVFIPLAGTFNSVVRGSVTEDGFQSTYRFIGKK